MKLNPKSSQHIKWWQFCCPDQSKETGLKLLEQSANAYNRVSEPQFILDLYVNCSKMDHLVR